MTIRHNYGCGKQNMCVVSGTTGNKFVGNLFRMAEKTMKLNFYYMQITQKVTTVEKMGKY